MKTLLLAVASLALGGLGYQLLIVAVSATRTTTAVLEAVGRGW